MSKVFIIADTHFGDSNIIKYENRPFIDIADMDEKIITLWNKTVSEEDIVFHLGDVGVYTLEKMKKIIRKLNGNKILIMGNHDNYLTLSEWMECGFSEVYRYPIIYNEFILIHLCGMDVNTKKEIAQRSDCEIEQIIEINNRPTVEGGEDG